MDRKVLKQERLFAQKSLKRGLSSSALLGAQSPSSVGVTLAEQDRRARFDERLRTPQAWLQELDDMDSLTANRQKLHTSKKRDVKTVSRAEAEISVRNALAAKARGDIATAITLLHPAAHGGDAAAQFHLGDTLVHAALEEDARLGAPASGGAVRGAGVGWGQHGAKSPSEVYYTKARKLLKKAAKQVTTTICDSSIS